MKTGKIILAVLLCAPGAARAAVPEMIALSSDTYDSGGIIEDKATAVATDSDGNIYVAGTSDSDYLMMKYSKTLVQGTPQLYSNGRSGNIPAGIAVDGLGNIVVAGMETGASLSQDYLVLKYSPNFAALISSVAYDSGNYDRASSVITDDQNNIFVTGYTNDTITDNFYTIKYDASLTQLSSAAYDSGDTDQAAALAFSGSDIVVAGYTRTGGTNYNVKIVLYDKDLNELDTASFDSGGSLDDRAVGVAVDSSGNIIVTARQVNPAPNFLTLKYDSFLNLLSSAVYNSGGVDIPTSVAVDSSDNIIVTGHTASDYFTIKYDQNFAVISTAAYDGSSTDWANASVVDIDDNIIVTGQSQGSSSFNFFTVKYNASPRITEVSPLYIGETANVTIKGKGLLADTTVYFDDPLISTGAFAFSSGQITLSVSPAASVLLGVTTVTVTNVNGESAASYTLAYTRLRTTILAGQSASITAMTRLGQIAVSVPAGSFANQETLTVYPVPAAAGDIQQVGEGLYLSGSPSTSSLVNMTITLRYSVADLGGYAESALSLAYYDATDGWVTLPSSVNTSAKSVTASARAAGTSYAVIKAVSSGGGGGGGAGGSGIPAKVYPNPYRPGSGGRFDQSEMGEGIVFAGMTTNQAFNLTIVDLAGQLVYQKSGTADANGKYLWDTKSVSGVKTMTGVYIYLITGGGEPQKGKFAIIR